jgi:SAM-dependent methyltransferase
MTQPAIDDRNADQIAYWNGPGGKHWTERQELQDIVLGPVSEVLIDRAAIKAGERVIDVGCGCGATSFDLAKKVAKADTSLASIFPNRCWAVPELTPAGAPVEFVLADATVYPCTGEHRPAVLTLRRDVLRAAVGFLFKYAQGFAAGRTPRIRMLAHPRDNPWMMIGLKEAYKFVPKLPEMKPDDPGPFSFADEERVRRILTESGFTDIGLERRSGTRHRHRPGLEAAIETVLAIGPTSRALENQPKDKVEAATQSIRTVLASHQKGETIPLGGSIWIVTASNGA